ncbi:integral membrane sensor signal transduction histidine kinase [Desulfovibrio sp. X2]|uniref:ATP-binding protein n=1 Tax=Desulfovibrio sp. X2 TaxID=941449 RepID=UPI000358DE07|nr:ATP-binding protein [Desulfovibrio sp. X2]EPR37646.1 integral membrane sensor signal transduction histidine kinase [Desulfovibrio sp. X2]
MGLPRGLYPKSLYGQLVLVLLGGMVLLQIITAMYLIAIRGPHFLRDGAYSDALSAAREVKVLDALPVGERADMAARLSDPSMNVRIVAERPVLEPLPREQESGGAAQTMRAALTGIFGTERGFLLRTGGVGHYTQDQIYGAANAEDHHFGMTFPFSLAVRMDDGSWALFTRRVPVETPGIGMLFPMFMDMWWRFVLILLLVLLVVRWVTRPLRVLAQAADEFGTNLAHTPLPEKGPTETRRAIQAFNRMQRRIRQFVEERSRMLAAISHDLKTPVTRLRLRCDLIEPADLQKRFVADLDELRDMLCLSLDFVRSIERGEEEVEVDLNSLLESLRDDYAEIGQSVECAGEALEPLPARPAGLKRCLTNLLDNAVRYGGAASVEIEDQGDNVTIAIRDRGPGIPEKSLPRVFEPFFRVEGSRSPRTGGHGLGLSIARNIALQHGGDIRLRNLPEGGLEALLSLPRRRIEGTAKPEARLCHAGQGIG